MYETIVHGRSNMYAGTKTKGPASSGLAAVKKNTATLAKTSRRTQGVMGNMRGLHYCTDSRRVGRRILSGWAAAI